MAFRDIEFLFRHIDNGSADGNRASSRSPRDAGDFSHASDESQSRQAADDSARAEEITLAAQLASGDPAAFDELFHRHFLPLVAYVRRFVDSSDTAEDLAQDAFVHIWNIRDTIRRDVPVVPLLRTITRRAALKQLRHLRVVDRAHDAMQEEQLVAGSGIDTLQPDAQLVHAEVVDLVRRTLATLPPRIRLVAVMRWIDGLGRHDVAVELGVSVRTVDAQLYQAAARIRAAIAPYRTGPTGD